MASTTSSVREALDFVPGGIGSVAQRFSGAGMDPLTGSLRELMDEVSPETRTFVTEVDAGDVTVRAVLTVASNGDFDWTLYGEDDGTFFGDSFTVTIALNRPASDGTAFGLTRKETLESDDKQTWTMVGNSPWLVEHWDLTGPPTGLYVHLHVSWDVEVVDILKIVGIGLGVALVAFGGYMIATKQCSWETTDELGNKGCVKRW